MAFNYQWLKTLKLLLREMNGRQALYSENDSEPQTGIEPATCTLAHHLSLSSSMVRASHRSSEGCGFDPRLGLRIVF